MPSMIDPTHPAPGIAVSKAASRANWAAAKAELEHGGFFLAHNSAVERRTQDKLRELGTSVKDYGAVGDGVADDTLAIQRAVDAVGAAGGGGVIYLPAGTYKIVMPQAFSWANPENLRAALVINHNNVTLRGAGMRSTVLSFRCFGDVDPLTVADEQRGYGILIAGGTSEAPRQHVHLEDFQLFGGTNSSGNWDSSHKAVHVQSDTSHRNHVFNRIWLRGWRGENFHHQGNAAFKLLVDSCVISNGRANAFNLNGGDITVRNCEAYDVYAITEDLAAGNLTYIGNYFHDTNNAGVTFIRYQGATPTDADFTSFIFIGNILKNLNVGIWVAAAHSIVQGNVLIDCGEAIKVQNTDPYPGSPPPNNPNLTGILIEGNLIRAERRTSGTAITVFQGNETRPLRGITVRGNRVVSADPATAYFDTGVYYRLTSGCSDVVIEGNEIRGVRYGIAHHNDWPAVPKVPIFRNNDFRDGTVQADGDTPLTFFQGTQHQGTPTIVGGVTQPLLPPIAAFAPDVPFAEPSIAPSLYMKGLRLKLTCVATNAPVLIARGSAHFKVPRDRFLYPDCILEVEFDGTRFVEVGWTDKRADARTTQTTGTTLDALGREEVELAYAAPTTLTAHQAVPEGVPITIYATNGNATLAHNASIAMTSGANLTLVANQPYRFVRIGSVLRQMA